jgi:hypothetical protein
MKKIAALIVAATAAVSANAAITVSPLTSFSGDGWLSPAEYVRLGTVTSNQVRGLAYNPVTKTLIMPTRQSGNVVAVLDSATGAELRTLNVTGITGGDLAINQVGVAEDGAVYVSNLRASQTVANTFKVYRWADDAAATVPTVAFNASPLVGARIGDAFDVIGSGANTRLIAGMSGTVAGSNGFAAFSTADGLSYTGQAVGFVGTPPANGDFRLGITFTDSDSVIGNQTGTSTRVADYTGAAGTLVGSTSVVTASGRLMDYAVVGGLPLLAVCDTVDAKVRIFNMTNPLSPSFIVDSNTLENSFTTISTAVNANTNGVGQVKWGEINGNVATLYALNTNNGIQAFQVVVPEPTTLGLAAAAIPALLRRRRA